MSPPTSSVLLVSYRREKIMAGCLARLAAQDPPPDEVIVVWQADDTATRDEAERSRDALPCPLRLVHSPEAGVVAAENAALDVAEGEVVLMLDDDSVVGPDWVGRHLAHYADPTVGAVGGPAANFWRGAFLPIRAVEPVGAIAWFGRVHGNMHDHVPEWRGRPPRDVDHLVGYNMSLRRAAFDRFESALRPYWQMFEMDACLQVRARGYRVVFDFGLVIEHHPNNTAYDGTREGDLAIKVYNGAYNNAYIQAKHSPARLRPWRLAYLLAVGSTASPGLATFPRAVRRYGDPGREARILWRTWRHHIAGWRAGAAARRRAEAGGVEEPRRPSVAIG